MDEQERHFIGDLLNCDDDVKTTGPRTTGTAAPSAGPFGAPPTGNYWPEPPPPYSPCPPQWAEMEQPGAYTAYGLPYNFQTGAGGNYNVPLPSDKAKFLAGMEHCVRSSHLPKLVLAHSQSAPYAHHMTPPPPHMGSSARFTAMPPPSFHQHSAPTTPPVSVHGWEYQPDECHSQFQTNFTRMLQPVSNEKKENEGPILVNYPPRLKSEKTTVPLPKAGKSYRDVVSGMGTGASPIGEKYSSEKLERSQMDGQGRNSTGDEATVESEDGSEKGDIGGKAGDWIASEIKSAGLLPKKNQSGKNLTTRNVTTNTGITSSSEFQKIVRKKGKAVGSENKPGDGPPSKVKAAGGNGDTTRYGVLASPGARQLPDASDKIRREKLNNEQTNEQMLFQGNTQTRKSAYINNDLSGVDDESARAAVKDKGVRGRGVKKRGEDSDKIRRRKKNHAGVLVFWIGLCFWTAVGFVGRVAKWIVDLITDIGCQLWDIVVHCSRAVYSRCWLGAQRLWYRSGEKLRQVLLRLRQLDWLSFRWWKRRSRQETTWGLDDNISLPATGDEAMKRLLSCRGQDAYNILGLRADCTDEEVRRYYKRQAVLVHPDKNMSYGAEEAFKILAHAFELIGTPEQRKKYDFENVHRTKAMQELEELLDQLKKKMEEALSTMHCDCGNKHRRFATKRPVSDARYCRRCKDYHPARENDIWAESQWLGFLWYYYACMDSVIYDITEWAGCPKNLLKHMKPNSHLVQYRLITGKNQRQPEPNSRPPTDADMEDFLSELMEERRRSGPGQSEVEHASYRPPSCPSGGDARPRKAGRRRKPK